jgi:hypothetical protein
MPSIAHKRGTRAQIDAAASVNALRIGEVYLITDEARLTIGIGVNAHQPAAKQGEGGGAGLSGTATINVTTLGGATEWSQSVAAAGVSVTNRIFLTLAPTASTDENDPELVSLSSLSGVAGAGLIIINAAFGEPTSGPITFNWSAV